ncbi:MAG: hypothetical protein WAU71_09070 [Pyrinomonadaceae bacterium]
MIRRVVIFLVLFALVGGVVSGTPLHSPNDKMMKCCDKARSQDKTAEAFATQLCCGLNCSESAPTSPGSTINFSPSNITVFKSIAEQIAAIFPTKLYQPSSSYRYSLGPIARTFQPKYLQHNSFLI